MSRGRHRMRENQLRSKAREEAFKLLFSHQFHDIEYDVPIPILEKEEPIDFEYTGIIVSGVLEHMEEIDEMIKKAAEKWTINRIHKVDLSILRLALYEMNFMNPKLDPAVAINEAVILAKRYSADDSYKFINGILDRYAK